MTDKEKQLAHDRRQVLIEEMERVIQENRKLIVDRTTKRLAQMGTVVR